MINFKCFKCGNIFDNEFKSMKDAELCKYCDEFDSEEGELCEE